MIAMTPHESGAVACLMDGLVLKQAADAMGCSAGALRKTLNRARRKVGARTNAHMVALLLSSDQRDQCVRCGQTGHLSKDCPWPAHAGGAQEVQA